MPMNTANAIGFFLLGTIMQVMPLLGGAAHSTADGQTLWLQFMGLVTGGIGAGYLLRMGAQEMSVMLNRLALRRAEAREQMAQGARAQQAMPLGVRVRF
jgi:hypothetical protein